MGNNGAEIKDKEKYQCGIGTMVKGDDGAKHIVEHDGVAGHPGDRGMEYIANKVIEALDMGFE